MDERRTDMIRLNRFIELDQAGHSATQIATQLGVTTRTITRWRNTTGRSKTGAPTVHPETDRQHAARLIEDGCSFAETAATIGVTPSTIRRWFPNATAWTRQETGLWRQALYGFGGRPLKDAA